jgi:hypothetical protein
MHKAGARQTVCSDGDTPAPSTSREFIIHSSNTRWRGDSQGRGCDTVILGNGRNLWQLLFEHKYLRKNSCTASCPLLQLRLCQSKHAITEHNYTCSLLQFGAVPNSNPQLILYTCWLPTLSRDLRQLCAPTFQRVFLGYLQVSHRLTGQRP